ncbi:MAG: ParB/RepB/Spo0J family partition protein [Desulfobulbus sp.]|jgi:ParB family chromosome partitioning protein|uniref:ParB/RepB/Spo0J family partition protein n=1 Tax=Desulfobulbus sp. TaxID=895 RepID=UPI0028482B10|nr:ParB/RepB/Spo0J family partition protein [Desulfobulbus sp.]MDR2551516.1 ParB/RepB/Spo0J family partition protein [Desulfobulbus sp.]
MKHSATSTIHRLLGSNNLLVIVADGYNAAAADKPGHFLANMALTLAKELSSYAVVNAKYKREIMDLTDVGAILTRPKVKDAFLMPIKKFKDEIENNGLPPLLLLFQCLAGTDQGEAMAVFGYGQGERASAATPHRPTIPASLLAKIRIAIEDQHLRTELAPVNSPYCGREPQHLNQLFKQKIYCADWYAPEVRSILISIRPDLVSQQETAESIGRMLAPAFAQFSMAMSLVRNIDINNIDVTTSDDLQYIFRLPGDQRYTDLLRESYIEELAGSIDRNGLLHPLVLLKKDDGRYKILCGFRRFQALKRINRSSVEAKVYQEADFSPEDFFNISLAENTKRRNLNPIEIGNFLESASISLGLSNAELAERFGGTLGIGKPGQNVSHSTIHKYRKVNQIRLRGESPEMISDVINEKLQFSIAAEVLAPIKSSADRDALYLHVIKPLAPTRPQLGQLLAQLEQLAPQLDEAIALNKVQAALAKALTSPQPAASLLKLLRQEASAPENGHPGVFKTQVDSVRTRFFGKQANKKDFNILPSSSARRDEVIVHFRIRKGETLDTLKRLCHALEQSDPFSWTKQADDS